MYVSKHLLSPVLGLALAACGSTGPGLLSVSSLPDLPALPSLSGVLTPVAPLPPPDSLLAHQPPTAVYSVVAQNALSCWTGPKGPFHKSHLFHADAASPTTGGQAEIGLHERDTTQKHPWGPRVFRIVLVPMGGGTDTRVEMDNFKLPRDLADALRKDVATWAEGRSGCEAQVVRPPAPEPTAAPAKPKRKLAKSG